MNDAKRTVTRTSWKAAALALGLPLILALFAPTAYASSSSRATGHFDITITPGAPRSDDGNTIIPFTLFETITGTLAGTRVGTGTLVLHPNGTFDARDSGVFTGAIGDASGTTTLSIVATGVFGLSVRGRFRTFSGTGGLDHVRSSGSFTGKAHPVGSAPGFAGTYTGQVRSSDE